MGFFKTPKSGALLLLFRPVLMCKNSRKRKSIFGFGIDFFSKNRTLCAPETENRVAFSFRDEKKLKIPEKQSCFSGWMPSRKSHPENRSKLFNYINSTFSIKY